MYFDFYNMDIYDTVLRDILGVNPTGDVVADTVYLFVLPVLTLFLFSHHISGLLSLGKSKLQYVFMAIVFFFVIQRGYYPLVAQYSLFAFVILMIWGAWTFITGKKYDDAGNPKNMKSYNTDVGGSAKKGGFPNRVMNMARGFGNLNPRTILHGTTNAFKDIDTNIDVELGRLYADLKKEGLTPNERQAITDAIRNLEQSRAHREDRKNT